MGFLSFNAASTSACWLLMVEMPVIGVAALMLVAVLGFWWLQWQQAPAGGLAQASGAAGTARHHGQQKHDDD